jgi:hypothetical protein
MKTADFNAAMAMYADADRRATAGLIEMLTAAVLLKLNPPARGDDVVSVTVSQRDIEETIRTHHFDVEYRGDEMTVFLTPLAPTEITSEES